MSYFSLSSHHYPNSYRPNGGGHVLTLLVRNSSFDFLWYTKRRADLRAVAELDEGRGDS